MQIRLAKPDDINDIHRLIYELAVYEKAPDEMVATVAQIEQSLFNDSPVAFCHVAEVDGKIGGKLTAETVDPLSLYLINFPATSSAMFSCASMVLPPI